MEGWCRTATTLGGGACITDDLTQSRIILSNRAKYLIKIGLQINLLIVCWCGVCANKQEPFSDAFSWGGSMKHLKSWYSSFRSSLWVRTREFLPLLLLQWHTERWKQDIFHKFEQNWFITFRQRDARTFLLKHKAQSELLTGGEHKNRGLWAALRVPVALVEQCDPASEGDVKDPFMALCRARKIWSALCWCSVGRQWPSSGSGSR